MEKKHQSQQFAKGKIPQDPKSNNNAVIYTRVASRKQADTNHAIESQRKYCIEYATKNDLNVLGFFGETYEKTDERNEFNRMIKFLKNSKKKFHSYLYIVLTVSVVQERRPFICLRSSKRKEPLLFP